MRDDERGNVERRTGVAGDAWKATDSVEAVVGIRLSMVTGDDV